MVVSAHGCAMRSPVKLDAGVLLHFHSRDGREATAKVVSCQALDPAKEGWRLGARLDRPENFWGLKSFPQDWSRLLPSVRPGSEKEPPKLTPKTFRPIRSSQEDKIPASLKTMLESLQKQVADERLRALVAEAMQPLLAEVAELRGKVSREQSKERSKFEVSLSHIPPELQVQIEGRLRKELGPRVLDEARLQAAQLLDAAKGTIEKMTSDSHAQYRQHLGEDLRAAEKRVQAVSADVVEHLRDQLRRELGEFHQHVMEAGNRLKRLSEELMKVQQQSLAQQHEGHRRELEQLQAAVGAESSRLQAEVADLNGRIARLDESARGLESGLDIRLSKLSSSTVSGARLQLESAADAILEALGTRGEQQLVEQVDKAGASLGKLQQGVEKAVSESLRVQAAGTLEMFEKSLDELARKSIERCRSALASGLNSLVRNLGDQFRME